MSMFLPTRQSWPRWARAATSPWVLSPVLVLALLVGAFLGYGAWTRHRPTHYARGGDAFGASGTLSSTTSPGVRATATSSPGAHRPPLPTRATPSPGTVQSRPTTAAGAGTSGPAGQSTSGGHAGSPPTHTGGPTQPRTGTYTLAVSGAEHVEFGPFSACSNTFPDRSTLVIQHASGEPAGSFDFDQRFFPDSPNKHDERHIYRYTPGAVFLSFEQATVTCAGVKQSSSVNYSPLQTRVRLPLSVGASWHNHGGDSSRSEDGTSKVVGSARLTVAGHSYLTYVIDTHITMTGDESGSRDQRWWWSPDLGLPLKWHESLSGNRSGATYRENVTCTVVGTP